MVSAYAELHRQHPFTERVIAEVLAEFCVRPSFAPSVHTKTFLMPLPLSKAMPRSVMPPAFNLAPSATLVMKERMVNRVYRDCRLWRGAGLDCVIGRIRNAIGGLHPEAVEIVVQHRDLVDVLDPISAVVPGTIRRRGKPLRKGKSSPFMP